MIEFFKEILQATSERIKNRVFGPFFISFIFWNWQPLLLILASNQSIELSINHIIEKDYFTVNNVLLVPLLISLAYTLVQPFISLLLGFLIKWPIKKAIEANTEIRKSRKEGDIQLAHLDFEKENAKAGNLKISDLNNKIKQLEKSNETYIKDNKKARESLVSLEAEFTHLKQNFNRDVPLLSEYIKQIITEKYPDQVKWEVLSILAKLLKEPINLKNENQDIIKDLSNKGLIKLNNQKKYDLTNVGKALLNYIN